MSHSESELLDGKASHLRGLIVSNEIDESDASLIAQAAQAYGVRIEFRPCPSQADLEAVFKRFPATAFILADFLPTFTAPAPLRWVQLMSTGVNHDARGPVWENAEIAITTASGVLSPAMAQYIIGALLHWAAHFDLLDRFRETRDWGLRFEFRSSLLLGKTLGLLGYGGVGRDVSGMAIALGMRVLALRRTSGPENPERFEIPEYSSGRLGAAVRVLGTADLDHVLQESDFLACTLPLTASTKGLIGRDQFAVLKPGCILVNVSRGAVIDEDALISALNAGIVARAYLDVFSEEPLPRDHRLWSAPNTFLTPHASGIHDRASQLGARLFVENVRRYAAGERLLNLVDRDAGY